MSLTLPPKATPVAAQMLGSTVPDEILYEAEQPVVFTLRTAFGQRMLSYVADEPLDCTWLLLAPCTERTVLDLREGRLSVREALVGSWLWLARLDRDQHWDGVWTVEAEDIPEDHLPQPGTLLYPDLEPVVSARVIGAGISRAGTPASVIAYAADSVRKAIKILLEHLLELDSHGRPTDSLRELYDLPAQRFAFNSFEISFAPPLNIDADDVLKDALELLQRGLTWATAEGESASSGASDPERSALLRALLELTPPSTGPIEAFELGGRWLPRGTTRLTRASRGRVRSEMKRLQAERVITLEGRIGQLDRDRYSFTLRDVPIRKEVGCLFGDELFDDVIDAFNSSERVKVVGVERSGKLHVTAVSS
ncbi:MAG TPA: hypothetical protein VLS89_06835 [Candidatus Nanopelagicales bacterium]|nr:hypothetical protein [Candidatus Nanopelagicales bacterium]